jgi:hypothetical protein
LYNTDKDYKQLFEKNNEKGKGKDKDKKEPVPAPASSSSSSQASTTNINISSEEKLPAGPKASDSLQQATNQKSEDKKDSIDKQASTASLASASSSSSWFSFWSTPKTKEEVKEEKKPQDKAQSAENEPTDDKKPELNWEDEPKESAEKDSPELKKAEATTEPTPPPRTNEDEQKSELPGATPSKIKDLKPSVSASSLSSAVSSSKKKPLHAQVNVIAIIAFDSPFFGLHPSVYTVAAPSRAASIIKPYIPPVPTLPPVPAAVTTATTAAVNTVKEVPNVAFGVAKQAASTSYQIVGALPGAAQQVAGTTYQVVGSAAAATASTAYQISSRTASTAYETASKTAAVASVVAAEVANKIPGAAKANAAALGGVALAGTAAALGFMPSALGLAVSIVPRLTLGRAVVSAGVGAVMAVSHIGAKVREEKEQKEKIEAEEKIVEVTEQEMLNEDLKGLSLSNINNEDQKVETGNNEEAEDKPALSSDEKGASSDENSEKRKESSTPIEAQDVAENSTTVAEVLFDVDADEFIEESDPTVTFAPGPESVAETAGLETALLIAAAALAHHSPLNTPVAEHPEYHFPIVSSTEETDAAGANTKSDEEAALSRIEAVDTEVAGLLRKVSMSMMSTKKGDFENAEEKKPDVITEEGDLEGEEASKVAQDVVDAELVKEVAPAAKPDGESDGVTSKAALPPSGSDAVAETSEQTQQTTESPKEQRNTDEIPTKSNEVESTPENAIAPAGSWTPWITVGIAGAAVAAGAYYSGGLSLAAPLVQRVAVAWALGHATEASKHLRFLYPLWGEAQKDWVLRVEILKGEVEKGRLNFRCFYIEVS